MTLQEFVVLTDFSLRGIEHDGARPAPGGGLVLAVFRQLREQVGRIPLVDGPGKLRCRLVGQPLVGQACHTLVGGKLQGGQVGLAVSEPTQYFGRVVGHLHAEAHAEVAGKSFGEVVLKAKAFSAEFEVGVRAGNRDDDEFACLFNVWKVVAESRGIGVFLGRKHRRGPPRTVLLAGRDEEQEGEDYETCPGRRRWMM